MSLKHLTDDEMQEYLDGNLSPENVLSVERHLESCSFCKESLKQYQSLYVGLANDEGFDLPKSFVKSVISRLQAKPEAKSHFNYANIFLTILGIILAVSITFYYLDLKPLGKAISNVLLSQYEFGSALLVSIKSFLAGSNGNISLLALAGLTLLMIAALDRLVFQAKYRW